MGVQGLWKLIEPSGKPVPLETLQNKVLAVDVSIWLHQAIKGFQDNKGAAVPNAHLLGIYHRICKLLYFKIKPVFVFDGGVPGLKRQTMEKRNQLKARNLNDAKKIQKQLLNTLLKHTAVTKVLSERTKSSLPVDSKAVKQSGQEDIYVLPPSQLDSTISSSDDEDYTSGSSSSPGKHWDIHNVDEKSQAFLSLPADIRHEILTDLKETRKQNSWGRIHELPTQSDDFSIYQMKRLLKRFSIQTSLEDAEKEMGGKTLSLGELESLLNDHGVVTDEVGKRIASDENTRYLYIKDVKKALEKARVEASSNLEQIDEEDEAKISGDNFVEKISEHDIEYQKDLELAILLSLESGPSTSKVGQDDTTEPSTSKIVQGKPSTSRSNREESQNKKENKKFSAAISYMMEYSGLTPSGIEEIINTGSNNDKEKGRKATHIGVADVIDSSDEEMIEINELIKKQQEQEIANKSNEPKTGVEEEGKFKRLNKDEQRGEIGRKIQKSLEDLQENASISNCKVLDDSNFLKNIPMQQATVSINEEENESKSHDSNKSVKDVFSIEDIKEKSKLESRQTIERNNLTTQQTDYLNKDVEILRKNYVNEINKETKLKEDSLRVNESNFIEDSVEIMSSHSESSNDFIDVPQKELARKLTDEEKLPENIEVISSDSESSNDFIDVSEENSEQHLKSEKKMEIVFKTDQNLEDDMFSDIFDDDSNATTRITDVLKLGFENLNKCKIIEESPLKIIQEQPADKEATKKQQEGEQVHEKQQENIERNKRPEKDEEGKLIYEEQQEGKEGREKQKENKEVKEKQEEKKGREKQQEDKEAKEKQQDKAVFEDNEGTNRQQEGKDEQQNGKVAEESNKVEDDKNKQLEETNISALIENVEIKEELEDLNTTSTERNLVKDLVESLGKSLSEGPQLTTAELKSLEANLLREKSDFITERSTKERMAGNITEQMRHEAQELLQLFGVPYIVAPMEAEAQCAFLNEIDLTDGTITDDSDIWLFGGKTVYKNFFNQNKVVMEFRVENIEHNFKLTRQQLVLLALLVGSDYTTGIQGVGPVTALEILAAFPPSKNSEAFSYQQLAQGLVEFRNWFCKGRVAGPGRASLRSKLKNIEFTENFPSVNVIHAYFEPKIESSREKFSWGRPDIEALTTYAKKKFGWNLKKSEEILKPVMRRLEENRIQTSLHDYFRTKHKISSPDHTNKLSKRVKKAVDRIGGEVEDVEVEEKTQKPRKPRKKAADKIGDDVNVESVDKIGGDVGAEKKARRPRKKDADKIGGDVEKTARRPDKIGGDVEKRPRKPRKKAADKTAADIEVEKNSVDGVELEVKAAADKNVETETEIEKKKPRIRMILEADTKKAVDSREIAKQKGGPRRTAQEPQNNDKIVGDVEKKPRRPRKKAADETAADIEVEKSSVDGVELEVKAAADKDVETETEIEKKKARIRMILEADTKKAVDSREIAKQKRGPRKPQNKMAKRPIETTVNEDEAKNEEPQNKVAKKPVEKDEDIEIFKLTEEFSSKRAKQIEETARKALEEAKKAVPIKLHKKETIPQKLQSKSDLMRNKMRAIEVFRKSKQGPGFLKRRQKLVRKPKDDAELSESSSSD